MLLECSITGVPSKHQRASFVPLRPFHGAALDARTVKPVPLWFDAGTSILIGPAGVSQYVTNVISETPVRSMTRLSVRRETVRTVRRRGFMIRVMGSSVIIERLRDACRCQKVDYRTLMRVTPVVETGLANHLEKRVGFFQ